MQSYQLICMIDDQLGAGCNPSNSLETSNISYNSIERDMSFQYDTEHAQYDHDRRGRSE